MTAQIINFTERRQQLRRSHFVPMFTFWSLFEAYFFLGAVSYGVFINSINAK